MWPTTRTIWSGAKWPAPVIWTILELAIETWRRDDLVRVRCWVRQIASRRVEFGYAVELCSDSRLLATAATSLIAIDSNRVLTAIPAEVRNLLVPVPDPIRL